MMDYLLGLLEEAEEVLMESEELSLPQEDDGSAYRRRGKKKESHEEPSGLLAERVLPKEAVLVGKQDRQEERRNRRVSDSASEERLEEKLRRVWALAPQVGRAAGKAVLEEGEHKSPSPGAFLLERMQQKSRLADVSLGGRSAAPAWRSAQEERGGKPAYWALSAFDHAVERDARCYDNGFSLL